MATPDRVLDLTTDHARPIVGIDAVDYYLRTLNDLTLDAYKTIERTAPRIAALLSLETMTPAQGSELQQLLDRACRIALVAPDDLHARLSHVHRVSIYRVFIQLLTPSLWMAARAIPVSRPSAGTNSFPGSNGSIPGAVMKRGQPGRRSAPSRRP